MKSTSLTLLAALLSLTTGAQAGNLLVNGSFELPTVNAYTELASNSNAITGWKTVLSGVEWFNATPYGGAADGQMVVDLANYIYTGGGIEQTFATVAGKTYDLTFSLSTMQWSGRDGTARIDVTVAGNTTGYDVTNHTGGLIWTNETLSFVATGANTTLSFTNNQNPDYHFAIVDGVSAVAAPVPEPETYGMLLAGLGLMGFIVRRKKNA
jgi:hypothetical protein